MERNESPPTDPSTDELHERLSRALRRARMALLWERLRLGTWMPLSIILVFAATALSGILDFLPTALHVALLAGFSIALVACLFHREGLARLRVPSLEERARRLERENALAHRPLCDWNDTPALNADNGLWQAHRAWQKRQISKILYVGKPRPPLASHDTYALRVAALMLAIAGLGIAANPADRLRSAFYPFTADNIAPPRLEIWITPPVYTGRAAVYPDAAPETLQTKNVPVNSELVIQLQGDDDARLRFREIGQPVAEESTTGEQALEAELAGEDESRQEKAFSILPEGGLEFRTTLETGSEMEVSTFDREDPLRWRFTVIPDLEPEISFREPVGYTALGSLRITYATADDYGVVNAGARIELDVTDPQTASHVADNESPLDESSDSIILPLTPSLEPGEENREYHELTSHPWAGLPVRMTLFAEDEVGQKGYSETVSFHLPELAFESPLARAYMEMRRNLALDPDSAAWAARAINALAYRPELYETAYGDYLHLRSVYRKLSDDVSPRDLKEARDLLWHMALRAETGELSDIEERLRAVREALQRAFEEGASDSEIQQLLKRMSTLLTEYLREQARQNNQRGTTPPTGNIETIDADQLSQMLQQISDLTALGAYEEAQEMLSKLEDLLENLQFARGMTEQEREFNRAMGELQALEQEQQRLLDQTFQEQMRTCPPGEECSNSGMPNDAAHTLQELQEALRRRLSDLLEQMETGGVEMPQSLPRSEQSMGEAVEGLGEGDLEGGLQAQSDALEQLRQGRSEMMRSGGGATAGGPGSNGEGGRTGNRHDPLGRSMPDDGSFDEEIVPDDYDRKRARELRAELLRRMGEAWRTREELDYFERLLRSGPTGILH